MSFFHSHCRKLLWSHRNHPVIVLCRGGNIYLFVCKTVVETLKLCWQIPAWTVGCTKSLRNVAFAVGRPNVMPDSHPFMAIGTSLAPRPYPSVIVLASCPLQAGFKLSFCPLGKRKVFLFPPSFCTSSFLTR